jgi:hypothetical protein
MIPQSTRPPQQLQQLTYAGSDELPRRIRQSANDGAAACGEDRHQEISEVVMI